MFIVKVSVFLVGFRTSILNRSQVSFVVGFSVSETDLLVECQLCGFVFPKEIFGVVGPFSTAF
ncbi:hypothetical protein KB974_004733 [Vibrio parahaemolyticus]|nr:hypothetical protein [Vibrio parahaemolyticus]EHJ9962178.1 hypothetical protein [Vibrio parahaemolyticus]